MANNYLICDRTGFKVKRGGLVKEWNGLMVRPESWEPRQMLDMIRSSSSADEQRGSPRPEPDDVYITDRYPSGVTADDL